MTRKLRIALALTVIGGIAIPIAASAITGPASPGNHFGGAYHVVFIISAQGRCSGTVVSKRVVLTTAHCAPPGIGQRIVMIDDTPINISVADIIVSPGYDPTAALAHRATSDIAALILSSPLPLFIATPSISQIPIPGSQVGIVGFGENEFGSGGLRSGSAEVQFSNTLQMRLVDPKTKGNVLGIGSCTGDSGGPVFNVEGGAVSLVGIMSWSTGPNKAAGCGGLTGVVPLVQMQDWLYGVVTRADGSEAASKLRQRPTETRHIALDSAPGSSVSMTKSGGIFVVPVQINGTITLDFAVDSGAADVSVPADVFSTLLRTGTVKSTDLIGKGNYVMADGSKTESITFMIRSLKVGDHVVENVKASVTSAQGMLLLGQSFLERFPSWSIDNATQSLKLQRR